MKKSANHIVALDISPASLKLAEYLPLENQIATVFEQALDPNQWGNDHYLRDTIGQCVKTHVQGSKIEIVSSVSGDHSLVRQVEIPNSEDNIQDAIEWEMEQYLVHPLPEYLMDWQALGPNREETARLFLVAAFRRQEALRLKHIIEQTGHPLSVLDVDFFAAQNVFEVNYPERLPLKTLLIKADAHSLKCLRVQNGGFLGCDIRSVDESLNDLGGADRMDRIRGLTREVHAIADRIQSDWGLEACVLCGDLAVDRDFRTELEAGLPIEVVALDTFRHIGLQTTAQAAADLQAAAPRYAGVVGLALRSGGDC
jgi:Tfp pilus assembly PilM family ATPase